MDLLGSFVGFNEFKVFSESHIPICCCKYLCHLLTALSWVIDVVGVGVNSGQYIYNMVFESGAAYGKFMDTVSTDSEWIALWAEGVAKQMATPTGNRLSTLIEI